jgi:methyl-accepting chemotaxis protein
MQQMQSGLRQMIAQIDSSSQELLAAAAALTQAAAGMAQSSSEQSATASGMAQTLFRVAGGVAELADSAHKTDQTAYAAGALAHQGSELVGRIVNEMYGTAVVVRHLAEAIDELDKQAAEISSVVSLIRDVADQTDVLSLNAAMEAARAGQHGRGFSAVADEVRKLSERTAKSSRAVATMIDGIQHSARATSEEVAAGSQRVQDNVTQMNQVGQAMQQIRVGTDEVMAAISTISKSLAQQSTANREISSDVERVAALTQKSSDSAQEISAATQRLATLATTLRAAVSRFKR